MLITVRRLANPVPPLQIDTRAHLALQNSIATPATDPRGTIRRTQGFGFNPKPLPAVNLVRGTPRLYGA